MITLTGHAHNLTGKRFDRLLVLEPVDKNNRGQVIWKCVCDCGNLILVLAGNLKTKNHKSKSCGCARHYNAVNRKTKVCANCKENKVLSDFAINRSRLDKHSQYCKKCYPIVSHKYAGRYQEFRTAYTYNKRHNDVGFRIASNLRRRISGLIRDKNKYKSSRLLTLIDCSIDFLRIHLESRFDDKMSWDNYGSYWHIDHIKPCASFNLENEIEQKVCFHYSNLQPMEAIENIRKGKKILYE